MQFTRSFVSCKIFEFHLFRKNNGIYFLFLIQNMICGYSPEPPREAVLTSTQNVCFGSKLRTIGIPQYTPIMLYKSGVYVGIHFMDMFS